MYPLAYDLEIVKAIPEGRPEPGIDYCAGWDDHANMGISVIGAFDFKESRYRVFCKDNFQAFVELAHERWPLVSFNGLAFDNRVIEATIGFAIPEARCCDLLVAIWQAVRLGPQFEYPSHAGYGLDAVCAATFGRQKTGHGALAPVLWQRGEIGAVIDYCLNDVALTKSLWELAYLGQPIINPKTGVPLLLRLPRETESVR